LRAFEAVQKHKAPGVWAAECSAEVKEEPAQRAGDTQQGALPPGLPGDGDEICL
jgi:hypothetical protein